MRLTEPGEGEDTPPGFGIRAVALGASPTSSGGRPTGGRAPARDSESDTGDEIVDVAHEALIRLAGPGWIRNPIGLHPSTAH
jgi:hypothetical protein